MIELLKIIQAYQEAEKEVFNALKNQGAKTLALNKEISDYLHILELVPLKASEITKVTAKLRAALKERRELKVSADLNCNINNPNSKTFTIPTAESLLQTYVDKRDKYVEEATESYNRHFKGYLIEN